MITYSDDRVIPRPLPPPKRRVARLGAVICELRFFARATKAEIARRAYTRAQTANQFRSLRSVVDINRA